MIWYKASFTERESIFSHTQYGLSNNSTVQHRVKLVVLMLKNKIHISESTFCMVDNYHTRYLRKDLQLIIPISNDGEFQIIIVGFSLE